MRRSAITFVIRACSSGESCSYFAKSAPKSAPTVISDAAFTVAFRRVASSTAASPKKSPGPSSAITAPPRSTEAVPSRITKKK